MAWSSTDKKSWIILEIVRDFLRSYSQFMSLYERFKSKTLHFNDVDKFISDKEPNLPLYNLKESCHQLFRHDADAIYECSHQEKLLDLAVGSIFHEAMKIREYLYQLEVYKPRYIQIRGELTILGHERDLLPEFFRIGVRAEKGLSESMSETYRLFKRTLRHVADLLERYRDNDVLIRFLLQNKHLLQQAFGKSKGLQIVARLFPGGLAEAYEVGGRSYLGSEHFDLAAEFFQQASKRRPHDSRLKSLWLYARGMDGYYRNKYDTALKSFAKFLAATTDLRDGRDYLRRVEDVCRKMRREYLEDKKMEAARLTLQLAEQASKALARAGKLPS